MLELAWEKLALAEFVELSARPVLQGKVCARGDLQPEYESRAPSKQMPRAQGRGSDGSV